MRHPALLPVTGPDLAIAPGRCPGVTDGCALGAEEYRSGFALSGLHHIAGTAPGRCPGLPGGCTLGAAGCGWGFALSGPHWIAGTAPGRCPGLAGGCTFGAEEFGLDYALSRPDRIARTAPGVAPGWRADAPLARKICRTKGAKPHSPGQRLGSRPPHHRSPERASLLHPSPFTLHPSPFTLHPSPFTPSLLHPFTADSPVDHLNPTHISHRIPHDVFSKTSGIRPET